MASERLTAAEAPPDDPQRRPWVGEGQGRCCAIAEAVPTAQPGCHQMPPVRESHSMSPSPEPWGEVTAEAEMGTAWPQGRQSPAGIFISDRKLKSIASVF